MAKNYGFMDFRVTKIDLMPVEGKMSSYWKANAGLS